MNHKEIQDIATKHGFGQVYFQFNVAKNTGRQFEVGYVSIASGRSLFCKRASNSNPDQLYLCNEYAKLEAMPGRQKSVDKLIQEIAEALAQFDTETVVEIANFYVLTTKHRYVDDETVEEIDPDDKVTTSDVCPHCGSQNTKEVVAFINLVKRVCHDCGQTYPKE